MIIAQRYLDFEAGCRASFYLPKQCAGIAAVHLARIAPTERP